MSDDSKEIAVEDIALPRVREFLAYWQSLRAGRFAPSWREFNLLALDPRSIPHVVVVDVVREPLDFVYRFWGTAHVTAKGFDKTGKSVAEPPQSRRRVTFQEYEKMVAEKQPLAAVGTVDLPEMGRVPFTQTIVRLPLSDDGAEVDKIVSIAVWERRAI